MRWTATTITQTIFRTGKLAEYLQYTVLVSRNHTHADVAVNAVVAANADYRDIYGQACLTVLSVDSPKQVGFLCGPVLLERNPAIDLVWIEFPELLSNLECRNAF